MTENDRSGGPAILRRAPPRHSDDPTPGHVQGGDAPEASRPGALTLGRREEPRGEAGGRTARARIAPRQGTRLPSIWTFRGPVQSKRLASPSPESARRTARSCAGDRAGGAGSGSEDQSDVSCSTEGGNRLSSPRFMISLTDSPSSRPNSRGVIQMRTRVSNDRNASSPPTMKQAPTHAPVRVASRSRP